MFMACVKLSRSQQGDFHEDDYIDAAAYIALAGAAAYGEVRPSRKGPSKCENVREDEGDVHRPVSYETRFVFEPSLGLPRMPGKETTKDDE